MPKITSRPSGPTIRHSTARKVVADEKYNARREQSAHQKSKEIQKNKMIATLQNKQERIKEEGTTRVLRSSFMAHHAFFDSHDNAPNYISAFSANLNVMMQVAERAGRGLIHDFNEIEKLQISQKGAADFASTADFNSEKTIKEGLLKAKPKYGFLQEESGEIKGEDTSHRWIIDPLDGTMNFLHAVPHFAISIALQEDQEIIAGVIFNPITNEMFVAEKGKGAWIVTASGKTKLHVSNRSKLNETVVVTGIPHLGHSDKDEFIKQLTPMMEKTGGVRRMGSASLDMAYVAAGRFDCYWERDIKPWDIAAGALIVKEAGGVMTDLDSNTTYKEVLKSGSIIASNEVLAETFKGMLIVK